MAIWPSTMARSLRVGGPGALAAGVYAYELIFVNTMVYRCGVDIVCCRNEGLTQGGVRQGFQQLQVGYPNFLDCSEACFIQAVAAMKVRFFQPLT